MLKEGLEFISTQAKKAAGASVLEQLDLRNKALIAINGELNPILADIPRRDHTVNDLESLSDLLKERTNATVWHHGDMVVAVLDDSEASYRDDRVQWPLVPSTKWLALIVEAPKPRDHASFVHFLVQNLRDELEAAQQGLLGRIRSLNFKNVDTQTGDVQQGRESMGRDIQNELIGAKDLPETVKIRVRRWAAIEYTAEVECLLLLDVVNRKISLKPLADELEQAENLAQKYLHEQLTGSTESPVYYGSH